MNDEELRALVRAAVARQLRPAGSRGPSGLQAPAAIPAARDAGSAGQPAAGHPSHHLYLTIVNTGEACVIEPAVTCDHCGYCKSHGH